MSPAFASRSAAVQGGRAPGSLAGVLDRVVQGDCTDVMRDLPTRSIDLVLTDPPYLVNYRSRDGQKVANDNNPAWLEPSFREIYRVLKEGSFCVSFYGWNRTDLFMRAWRGAGFRVVGHIVFRQKYASSVRYLRSEHEMAYLLAKGDVQLPSRPIPDVIEWPYSGNRLHPTQKPVAVLRPLVDAFCPAGGVVLDPFCGSGSTLVAANDCGRRYIGIELEGRHCQTAEMRLYSQVRC